MFHLLSGSQAVYGPTRHGSGFQMLHFSHFTEALIHATISSKSEDQSTVNHLSVVENQLVLFVTNIAIILAVHEWITYHQFITWLQLQSNVPRLAIVAPH